MPMLPVAFSYIFSITLHWENAFSISGEPEQHKAQLTSAPTLTDERISFVQFSDTVQAAVKPKAGSRGSQYSRKELQASLLPKS